MDSPTMNLIYSQIITNNPYKMGIIKSWNNMLGTSIEALI